MNIEAARGVFAMGEKPMDALLQLSKVSKSFQSKGQETIALDSIDLDIKPNEFLAIVGPSGCGKSTLLQIAAGLLKPTSGATLLHGKPINGPPSEIVYLFQQYSKSLFPWRSVERNVSFPLEKLSISKAEQRERAMRYLEMVGLSDFAQHYPWQLSGGMQQRVAIARALAAEPHVLLMDEPFSAVDALTRLDLQSLILDIWQQRRNLTTVLITHDVDEAVYLADRVALLTRRPSKISHIFDITLARPRDAIRTREQPEFLKLRHELLSLLLERKQ
jgi:NitT/TauT family transport system ATP-binding protein